MKWPWTWAVETYARRSFERSRKGIDYYLFCDLAPILKKEMTEDRAPLAAALIIHTLFGEDIEEETSGVPDNLKSQFLTFKHQVEERAESAMQLRQIDREAVVATLRARAFIETLTNAEVYAASRLRSRIDKLLERWDGEFPLWRAGWPWEATPKVYAAYARKCIVLRELHDYMDLLKDRHREAFVGSQE